MNGRLVLTGLILLWAGFAPAARAAGMEIDSDDLVSGFSSPYLYKGAGCAGGDLSPELHWSGAPAGTADFAITIYDPDASGGWWHWAVWNIPAGVSSLPRGAGDPSGSSLPAGASQGRNDFGQIGYDGPCPPPGDAPHRYVITLYALPSSLANIAAAESDSDIARPLDAAALAQATLTQSYGRP